MNNNTHKKSINEKINKQILINVFILKTTENNENEFSKKK